MKPRKVRIIKIEISDTSLAPLVSNLSPGSIHDVIKTPKGKTGVWVKGVPLPVQLKKGEYEFIKNYKKGKRK